MLLFCIAWDSFLAFWYWTAFNKPGEWLITFIFPLPHLGVGIWLTYFILASLVNKTVVQLEDNLLTVRHGPLPYYRNHCVEVTTIVQLYCFEKRSNKSVSYEVNAILTDGSTLKLLRDLQKDEAIFLEDRLEDWMGIDRQAVPGELER
jgi:hypothetical protein